MLDECLMWTNVGTKERYEKIAPNFSTTGSLIKDTNKLGK